MTDLTVLDKPAATSVAYARAIVEVVPDRLLCDDDSTHDTCLHVRGARWPEPMRGLDLSG